MKPIHILYQRLCHVYFAALLLIGAIRLHAADSTNNTTSVSPVNPPMTMKALTAKWQDVNPDKLQIAATNGDVTAQTYLGYQDITSDDSDIQTQGVYWCRLAANQGFALAQDFLGWAYGNGKGVDLDYALGEKWMHRAADQGLVAAEYDLGQLLVNEFNKSGQQVANYAVAAEWYRKAADQGHVKAMFKLAELYNYGKLGDDQRANCIPWYLKAAAQGNADAQAEIGELREAYPNSELLKNLDAVKGLQQSAESGNLEAQFQLAKRYQTGDGVPKDAIEAFKWMQKAAQQDGNQSTMVSDARYQLGLMYEKGEGVAPDLKKAHELFRSAIEESEYAQGNPAVLRLGQMYEKGDDVPQNDRIAAKYYSQEYPENLFNLYVQGRGLPDDKAKVSQQIISLRSLINTARGCFLVGEIYYQGKLVPKDIAQTADWFNKAATQGSPEAMNRIGEMWAYGMNGAPDPKEAANWYRKAAAKGLAEAQYNLGLCYAKGEGVPANPVEAWKWLQLATDQKFPNAAEERDKMQATMTADQVKDARTLADQINAAGKQ
jgi:TPR repeat protein